ncbi:MAG TPA: AAA family ATPase [Chthoniobacteraceae bacterium]|jgi:hypothetical protein|nr:AAA family ATPase [Chthoniobacteraceae bacterium]
MSHSSNPTPAPSLAQKIVEAGDDNDALAKVLEPDGRSRKFGDVWSFSDQEHERLETVRKRIETYLNFAKHKRPLCIAVFGPPGSGKSFGVREVCKAVNLELSKQKQPTLKFLELNLTQYASPQDLAREVGKAQDADSEDSVPFIFFDEFDTSLGGAPLGWLSWFLAPMQDGKFIDNGRKVKLEKAVYVFAGGTAAKMEEFGARDKQAFRLAKGPDFVSRLHAHIDVRGPNDPNEQDLRRGMALSLALQQTQKRTGRKDLKLDEALVERLASAGRYRHGQRSVEAVITMMAERVVPPETTIGLDTLPTGSLGAPPSPKSTPSFLLDMQVDRGPLDPETIGGLIGLSGGGFLTGQEATARDEMWRGLAQTCWRLGATVAYGGSWEKGLTQMLLDLKLPTRLRDSAPESRVEFHAIETPPADALPATVVMVPEPLAADDVRKVAHYFRMRWQSGVRCRARVLLSGKTADYAGRMPGIIEEAMIAIALGQPIYVLGGFGGAAALLGELLGLSSWKKRNAFQPVATRPLEAVAHLFRPAGFQDLPLTFMEALSYVASHAIGGPGWKDNGLTVEENRQLFEMSGADEKARKDAIKLIERGLLRVFDK